MGNDKKLKRGLGDVSPGFFSLEESDKVSSRNLVPVVSSAMLTQLRAGVDLLRCMTILPFQSSHELLENDQLVLNLRKIFGELYWVTFGTERPWVSLSQTATVRRAFLSTSQIQEILHVQPASGHDSDFTHESTGIFLDPISLFEHEKNLLQLLDHAILHVRTDSSDSLVAAYQNFRACLEWNPTLHFLLLVDGKASEKISDLVYEKFTKIASRFMSHEISFMGWMENGEVRINEDLFLDNSETNSIWKPSKKLLLKMLH